MTERRNPTIWPNCSCGAVWRQSGNRTGHCSGCHRTFQGLSAFDRHRFETTTGRGCRDLSLHRADTQDINSTESLLYDVTIGHGEHDEGLAYWSLHVTDEKRAAFKAFAEKWTATQ